MPNERREKHHTIPVSLRWPDIVDNLMSLRRDVHRELHRTLDMPMRKYSRMQRRAKKQTNNKLVFNWDDVEVWADMQREFFLNFNRLPNDIQLKHIKNMMRQYDRMNNLYKKITWELQWDVPLMNKAPDRFHALHEWLIGIEKDIANILSQWARSMYIGK